jgi:hypothetical protein
MKFHMLERGTASSSAASSQSQSSEAKEKYNNKEYDHLIERLNPISDVQGSFQLTGLYVDRIYNKINKLADDLKSSGETTRRIGHRMEDVRGTLTDTLDAR